MFLEKSAPGATKPGTNYPLAKRVEGLTPTRKSRFMGSELNKLTKAIWILEGLIESNTLTVITDPQGYQARALATDLAFCVSHGRSWRGIETSQSKVAYLPASSPAVLSEWLETVEKIRGPMEQGRMSISMDQVNFASRTDAEALHERLIKTHPDTKVLIIDDLTRYTENSPRLAKEINAIVNNVRDVFINNGFTVLITYFDYHENIPLTLLSSADSIFNIDSTDMSDDFATLDCVKMRDHAKPKPIKYRYLKLSGDDELSSGYDWFDWKGAR